MKIRTSSVSVGNRLYLSVLGVFLVFAVAFIVFQQMREKQFKTELLDLRLQDYNARIDDALQRHTPLTAADYDALLARNPLPGLRLTVVATDGHVVYDNKFKDYARMGNHLTRPEVSQALREGHGSTVDRNSATMGSDYFYSATFFPEDSLIVRSALPYDDNLSQSLRADQHYIWFAIAAIVLLTLILYRFTSRLGSNITKLRFFASRADHNESLETEELAAFPNDELGDIAERIIKIYKRLQNTRREQDVLKRQLTQNIAHELKTPVASIQGYLETILDNPRIDEATKEQFLQRCFAQSQRLTSLLQDISTLNRMDDAPQVTDFADVDVSALVDTITRETALQLREHGMTFRNILPARIVIRGNQSLLYSVFRNLTDNAIAYAGRGTTITLTARREGDRWAFTFADNGTGVATEHLARIFERFYRVDKGRSRKMGGTGLGLAIVKNAVLLHGGSIVASNAKDGGLRFDFTLKA